MSSKFGPDGQEIWDSVTKEHELDTVKLKILAMACHEADRSERARLMVEEEGMVIEGGRGGHTIHPAVKIQRDSAKSCRELLASLRLRRDKPDHGGTPTGEEKSKLYGF